MACSLTTNLLHFFNFGIISHWSQWLSRRVGRARKSNTGFEAALDLGLSTCDEKIVHPPRMNRIVKPTLIHPAGDKAAIPKGQTKQIETSNP
jgi:hypothetical protein